MIRQIIGACLLVLGTGEVSAESTALFSEVPDSFIAASELREEEGVAQQFLRKANSALIHAGQKRLTLNLNARVQVEAELDHAYENGSGALVWEGTLSPDEKTTVQGDAMDKSGSIIIIRRGDDIYATLHIGEQTFKIEPLTGGTHVIKEMDPHNAPEDHPPGWEEDAAIEPHMQDHIVSFVPEAAAAPAVIDLLIVYTPAVRSNIRGLIDLAIAETNAGYRNSDINASVQLAHLAEVNYRESGDMRRDLDRFAGRSDGYMDNVHSMLEREGADVAILITNGGGYCGIARGIGSRASSAYAIVARSCATGNYTFAHEIGHLQGARHNPEQDSRTSPYPYGHGYANQSGGWRTVMSYNIGSCCRRQNFWSNPRQTFRGAARGSTSRHDNHRVLNATAPAMANFRRRGTVSIDGTFQLKPQHSNKCVDVADNSRSGGANVIQWRCITGAHNQQWELRDRGNGQHDIVARHSGQCLAVKAGSGAGNNGQNIEQNTCDGSATRRFNLVDHGDSIISIRNVGSGQCVDVGAFDQRDGTNILQWPCHDGDNQKFRLVAVDEQENRLPIANINGPYRGSPGESIQFSSRGSNDPDGSIISFQWDFGDGGRSNDENPRHAYGAPGTYQISLTVMDDRGATRTSASTATITSTGAQVCFFEHSEYRGARFCANDGSFNAMPSGWNDVVSSVRVPAGKRVEIFQHSNFGGARLVLERDITNLTAQNFNDRMSSYRIGSNGGGGEDWSAVASPRIDYRNDGSRGGRLFDSFVDDINDYTHEVARGVVQILYASPEDVPEFSELELRIENWNDNPSGVAWKAGRPPRIKVNINAYHLERVDNANRDVFDEVTGILYHEMTHAYQHASGVGSSAVEGLADTVRYMAGYVPLAHRRTGGHWTRGYKTTGFFLAWIQEEKGYDSFVHDFNQQGNPDNPDDWSWESAIRNTTGQDIQNLWNEYQAWLG